MMPPCGHPQAFLPILAGAGDWLEALLPFLFVGFWILSQVIAAVRRVGGRAAPRVDEPAPAPPRNRRPAVPADQQARGGGAGPRPEPGRRTEPRRPAEIDEQIAEFLRAARGERPPEQRQTTVPPRRKPAAAPAPPPVSRPAAAADHRVGNLDVGQTEVARHVQDVFSHELRHLQAGLPAATREAADAAPARPRASRADELVAMLRNPATVRQLVLLREVLDRPVDRW